MVSLNRTAVVVTAKQPFLVWLHSVDPTSRHLTLADLNEEPSVYLLPDSDSDEKAARHVRKLCAQILAHELDGWFRVPSAWPKARFRHPACERPVRVVINKAVPCP